MSELRIAALTAATEQYEMAKLLYRKIKRKCYANTKMVKTLQTGPSERTHIDECIAILVLIRIKTTITYIHTRI